MKRSPALILTLTMILAGLAPLGCQPYVNIPAQQADTASHNPNGRAVRQVMALAIRAALEDGGVSGPVQVMLPANTRELSYEQVVSAIGDQAFTPSDADAPWTQGVVFAKGVRIRGAQAEVDVARPVGDKADQLVTVYLTWNLPGGWRVDRVHVWRGVPVDEQGLNSPETSR